MFLNPAGTTAGIMGRQTGGLIGAAVAGRMQENKAAASTLVSDSGLAETWPSQPVVVGLTARRMLLWSHSQMRGKPKELIGEIPLGQIAGIDIEKKKATFDATLRFTDGSGILLEAPKVTNKPERFAATFSRLTGR